MKQYFLFCLLLLVGCCAYAQNYRPFLENKVHYFSSVTNYSVRVDSAGLIAGDSTFWMNDITVPAPPQCSVWVWGNVWRRPHFIADKEGFFGDHFISRTTGAYQFVSRAGDTATFHTQLPNGTTWNFLSNSNLTATISQRGLVNANGVVDSMITIDISDGRQYQLTQQNGLFSGPNLSYYLHGQSLNAAMLVEPPIWLDYKDFFEWHPGDLYNTYYHMYASGYDQYERWLVLNRVDWANGDSLTLTFKHWVGQYWHPSGGNFFWIDTVSVTHRRADYDFLNLATYEVKFGPNEYHRQMPWSYDYNTHMTLPYLVSASQGSTDSCGFMPNVVPECDSPVEREYTRGLGHTYRTLPVTFTTTTCFYASDVLLCYELAGQDSVLPCSTDLVILARTEPHPATQFKLVRNGQTGEMSVHWQGLASGEYQWQLFDLNGRLLRAESVAMSGTGQLPLAGPGSAGMYLLRIIDAGGSWEHTLRVPMMAQ